MSLKESVNDVLGNTDDEELKDYALRLSRHDWYYSFSDNCGVYRRGSDVERSLKEVAATKGGKYKELYDLYNNHVSKTITGR